MKIESKDDRLLFLKYALPCASTLVKRGNVSEEYVQHLVQLASKGKVPKEKAEEMFKVATAMCDYWAEKMHKDNVDSSVIRRYFLLEHSKVVDDRYEIMRDFNPVDCKTYLGSVVSSDTNFARVKTKLGIRRYRKTFVKDAKKGDTVIVHFDYIIERAPKQFITKMGVMNGRRKNA